MPNHNCNPMWCFVCNNLECSRNRNPRFLSQTSTQQPITSAQNLNNSMQINDSTNGVPQNSESINISSQISTIGENMSSLNSNFNVVYSVVDNLQKEIGDYKSTIEDLKNELNSYKSTIDSIDSTLAKIEAPVEDKEQSGEESRDEESNKYGVAVYDPTIPNSGKVWVEKKKLFGGTKLVLEDVKE